MSACDCTVLQDKGKTFTATIPCCLAVHMHRAYTATAKAKGAPANSLITAEKPLPSAAECLAEFKQLLKQGNSEDEGYRTNQRDEDAIAAKVLVINKLLEYIDGYGFAKLLYRREKVSAA